MSAPNSRAQSRAAHTATRKAHLADIKQRKARSKERAAASRRGLPWTAEERRLLAFLWGEFSMNTIAARLNRDASAVRVQAEQMTLPPPSQGTMSLAAFCRQSGYDDGKIMRAAEHVGVTPARAETTRARRSTVRKKRWAFTEEQQEAIVAFLAARPDRSPLFAKGHVHIGLGVWGTRRLPPCCVVCSTTERRHVAKGRCGRCDRRHRWLLLREKARLAAAPPQAEPQRRAA